MFSSLTKKLAFTALAVSAFGLSGCLQGADTASEQTAGHLKVSTALQGVGQSGGLAKANTIAYAKLIVTLISNSNTPTATDTIRDTIVPGQQGFTSDPTSDQTVDSVYTVKGLRVWTVTIKTLDTKDSVIHQASSTTPSTYVRVADTLVVPTITLVPRFTMYRGVFQTIPDSITTAATTSKQALKFTKFFLKVDGKIVDSLVNLSGFTKLQNDTVNYDYVTTSSHTLRLVAYGSLLNAAGVAKITDTLYAGEATNVNPGAGNSATPSITLNWTNPAGFNTGKGGESMTVTIGKVGRVTATGTSTGVGVVPKNGAH